MPLSSNCAVLAELQAIESYIDEIFVEEQMLTLVVCEDNHECFDQGVSQMLVNSVDVLWVNIFHVNFFILLSVERIVVTNATFGVLM